MGSAHSILKLHPCLSIKDGARNQARLVRAVRPHLVTTSGTELYVLGFSGHETLKKSSFQVES